MAERYFNNYQTTVAAGGYTASSGVLNVLDTSGITLNSGDTTRLSLYTGSPELVVILIVTAVNSSTQFAVTAETSDMSASAGDLVLNTLTVGGMNQIRSDISMMGSFANLPVPASSFLVAGQRYKCTDAPYEFIYDGAVWQAFAYGMPVVVPPSSSFSWVNQGGASVTSTSGFIDLNAPGAGTTSLRIRTVAQPSTPYTLDAVIINNNINPSAALLMGIGFRSSVSGRVMTLHALMNANNEFSFQVNKWNSPTSFSAVSADGIVSGYAHQQPTYLRLVNDGTDVYFYVSGSGGLAYFLLYNEALTTFINPTDICFFVDTEGSGGAAAADLCLISWNAH